MTEKTTAAVGEASNFPISLPSAADAGGSVLIAAASAVGAILYFRRKFSRDGTEIIKDKADGQLTRSLLENAEAKALEAKQAREETKEAWAAYNVLVAEVGQLRAANDYLKAEVARLVAELEKAQNKLDQVRDDLWKLRKRTDGDSGHTPLK